MTVTALAVALVGLLSVAAFGGPRLLYRAAPALARAPRVAALILALGAIAWILALVAIGPVIAWMSSGPALLPQQAAEVCARCLSAATPFDGSAMSLEVPAIIPLVLPAAGVTVSLVGLMRETWLLRRSRVCIAELLRARSHSETVLGYDIRLAPDDTAYAFSLPRRSGGVVLSRAARETLNDSELLAVLEHERAHIGQHHHLILALLLGSTRYFTWIPLIRAIRDAVPLYLEIAADDAAKRVTGTASLASALLKLRRATSEYTQKAAVLHAAGSARIRHLLGHQPSSSSALFAAAVSAFALGLAIVIAAVHLPYVVALVGGCVL